jgi:hypothetical protein
MRRGDDNQEFNESEAQTAHGGILFDGVKGRARRAIDAVLLGL